MRILRSKPVLLSAAIIIVYTLVGFFLVPYVVRQYLPVLVQEQFKKQTMIGEVRFNPYIFTFEVNDFSIQEPDGQSIAGFRRFFVDFELKSIIKWAWTFRQLSLEGPQLNVIVNHDGTLNLSQIAQPIEAPPPPSLERDQGPPRLIFENIVIDQGQIDFTDRRQATPATISFKAFDLRMENITTLVGQEDGSQTLTATTNNEETIRWTGRVSLNPVTIKGTIAIEKFQISTFWAFVQDTINLELPAGKLTATANCNIDMANAEPQVSLAELAATITGLELKVHGAETAFLEMPDLQLSKGDIDFSKQQVKVEKLALAGGRARLAVDENGIVNLEHIIDASKAPVIDEPRAPSGSTKPWKIALAAFDLKGFALDYQDASRIPGAKVGIGAIDVDLKAEAEAGGNEAQVRVNDIAMGLSKIQVGLTDEAEAIRIDAIGLAGGAYDFASNSLTIAKIAIDNGVIDLRRQVDGTINLSLLAAPPRKGAISREVKEATAEGHPFAFLAQTVTIAGLKAFFSDLAVRSDGPLLTLQDIAVVLNNVDGKSPMTFDAGLKVREGGEISASGTVDPSGPTVESEIQVAKVGLTVFQPYVSQVATIDLKSGTLSTRGKLRHRIKVAGAQTAYRGGFKLDNMRITESGGKETLVGWKSIQTDQLTVQLEPNRLEIVDLKVMQPSGKFIIEKDRSINVVKVIKSDGHAKKAETPAKASSTAGDDTFPYRVHRILVSEGKVDFADLSLFTPFGTKIHELKGIVAGMSSKKNSRAQIKLSGRVDDYGTANIDGELNTSNPKTFTNIGVTFRNVEMSRLTPYSGKFAGRKIDSGKLSVDLNYKIDNSQLAGDNKLVVERLTLGEKIQSPEAVDLPLDLAVALLEDANGVIDLGLPVSGNLDSPEFSYGALVWKAVVNLLTKAVTSPFRALGALLPDSGDEVFNSVAFDPGRSDVPPPEKEKLSTLAGALQKRPQLKLSVQGRYNPDTDRAELGSAGVRRTLAAHLGQKLDAAEDPGPVDFSSPDTAKVLETMFTKRFDLGTLNALKANQKAAFEKAKKDAEAAKTSESTLAVSEEDPGLLAKKLFGCLAEVEPVDEATLIKLADARAQAIVAELQTGGQIQVERIEVKPSTTDDKKDSVSAALDLVAGR
jgi:hypothetical protein